MAKLQSDLREFIALLNSRKVEYLVVGGHAVAFHGHPRFTGDIDFFIRASANNATRVLAVLGDFGFGGLGIQVDDLVAPNKIVQLGRPPSRIDILTSISGVAFDDALQTAVHGELDGQPVQFIGWDALLTNKKASGRDKDLQDIKQLTAVAAKRKG